MKRLSLTLVALSLLAVGVAAVAQTGPAVGKASRGSLAVPEMVEQADKRLVDMRAALRDSFEELKAAREASDIQRIDCVNKALTAIKGLVRLADQNSVGLQDAAARGDKGAAEHEFVKLSLASTKVLELSAQLKSCAGPTVSTETEGEPDREVLSDQDLPPASDDPLSWYSDTEVILQEPAASSPFI